MDYDWQGFVLYLIDSARQLYHSPLVLILKVLLGIYLAVLIVDIILLLILRDIPAHYRVGVKGMDIPTVSKRKMRKRWSVILGRLKTEDVSQYKLAVIEADKIVEDVLGGLGYSGSNMSERLEQVGGLEIDEHLESLKNVHHIRNRIVNEPEFTLDLKTTEGVIVVYEHFLKYLQLLD